jgi:hypothetical protein
MRNPCQVYKAKLLKNIQRDLMNIIRKYNVMFRYIFNSSDINNKMMALLSNAMPLGLTIFVQLITVKIQKKNVINK